MDKDAANNRYLNTNHPFVTVEHPLIYNHDPDARLVVHSGIHDIIDRLLKKRPTWRFKGNHNRGIYDGTTHVTKVTVYEGDEALGVLWSEQHWRTGNTEYHFDNFRLRAKRERSRGDYTTKETVAAKRILDAFYPKAPEEHLKEAEVATRVMHAHSSEARWNYDRKLSNVMDALKDYIVDNWDELRTKIANTTLAAYDLPGLRRNHSELESVADAHTKGKGLLVMRYGEKYITKHKPNGSDEFVVQVVDDVPDWARGKLGMLKLTEPKSVTPEVGSRCSDDVFYIVP